MCGKLFVRMCMHICVHGCALVNIQYLHILQSLITDGHYANEELKSKLDSLSNDHHQLLELWEQRHKLFSQCYQLQVSTSLLL